MLNENWSEDFEKRKEKEAEVEKRTLAFRESYESGNITEEEYQANIHAEYDYAEPTTEWVPIEDPLDLDNEDDQKIDLELFNEAQKTLGVDTDNFEKKE